MGNTYVKSKKAIYYLSYIFISIYVLRTLIWYYLPNVSETNSDSFFLPSNSQWTSEVHSRNLCIKLINFEMRYERLNNFTLMKEFTPLSERALNKLSSKIPWLQEFLFQHVNKLLCEIDEKYPYHMLNGFYCDNYIRKSTCNNTRYDLVF